MPGHACQKDDDMHDSANCLGNGAFHFPSAVIGDIWKHLISWFVVAVPGSTHNFLCSTVSLEL